MTAAGARDDWLDALRAAAILSVIAYHGVRMAPEPPPLVAYTAYGVYGVDLFFVLSGWLIGGLPWKEWAHFGNLELRRFWLRRALRTMPPYFIILAIAWGGVAIVRGEPFHSGYLVFIQNYYERLPFFQISWSLCIEEHFYLVAPLLAAAILKTSESKALAALLAILLAVAPLVRLHEYRLLAGYFGYIDSATHLHMDGLLVGFLASLLVSRNPRLLELAASRSGIGVIAFLGAAAIAIHRTEDDLLIYAVYPTIQALTFGLILMAGTGRGISMQGKMGGLFRRTAVCSYSAYLVHPIAIHLALATVGRAGEIKPILYWPVVAAYILASTALFYVAVERTSIALRDRLVPRRNEGSKRVRLRVFSYD